MILSDADTGTQSPSVQPSSPRASSSASHQAPAPPSYLSARSAETILSEVRPTRIKSDALRAVNVLLDELLWLILGCARSFSTDRLRLGLLKVLPTVLGKNALLEAEVELRAYIERNPPATPLPTDEPTIQIFPLQQAFELLRIKCEAYSSLGDQEEHIEVETALHSRMVQVAGDSTPKLAAVAPAALYLTAILEHVCEHVLSNVGRVVARDSSRSTAHTQDLYVALCEDESIYSLFKTMKGEATFEHLQIEQQSKILRPRRSKSLSRNDVIIGSDPPASVTTSGTPVAPKPRQSLDSAISNGSNSNHPNRGSLEKGRSKVIFKNPSRSSADNGNPMSIDAKHRRTNSLLGEKKNYVALPGGDFKANANAGLSPALDEGSMQDFDDLMRSGTTMKVSLTPDRLKTFEVFAKEKNQRANRSGLSSGRDVSSPPSSFPNSASQLLHKPGQPSRSRNQVESIVGSPEETVRSRAASTTQSPTSTLEKVSTPRSRSLTDARDPSMRTDVSLPLNIQPDSSEPTSMSLRIKPVAVDTSPHIPKQTRRQAIRNRESLDLDDVMDRSEEEMPVTKRTPLTPKSAQATTSGTRDLMDFLSEGPPEPSSVVTAPPGVGLSESRGAKQGRFRTIVSRLTGGSSNERLSSRPGDDPTLTMNAAHRSATIDVNGNSTSSRTQRGPLHSKRSVPNVATATRPIPPPSSPPPSESAASGSRSRQQSTTRKAVPPWDTSKDNADTSVLTKVNPKQADSISAIKPSPRPTGSSAIQPFPDGNTEMTSSSRRRLPRDVELPANGVLDADMKPLSPVTPKPSSSPTDGHHGKVNKDSMIANNPMSSKTGSATPFEVIKSNVAVEHVRDFRRLIGQAASVDECRMLADLFLARCGVLPVDEEPVSCPITPPMLPVCGEVDNRHAATLIEVLLGDGEPLPADVISVTTTYHPSHRPSECLEEERSSPPSASPPGLSPVTASAA